jgi:hypothetical protein
MSVPWKYSCCGNECGRMYSIARCLTLLLFLMPALGSQANAGEKLEKSPYFAYVGREFIFTIEVVKPGVPLLNYVSMTDHREKLQAKNIILTLGNRRAAARLLHIETDRYQESIVVPTTGMNPRSSFGFRLEGNFGDAEELYGAEIILGETEFTLFPLSKFDFETLVRKVDRLNLQSPDFRDDFRVLKLDLIGKRSSP